MIKKDLNNITIFQFDLLNQYNDIFHFITNRNGGVSQGNYSSLNCSFNSGDLPENVKQNRKVLSKNLKIPIGNFYFPEQNHTKNIKIIKKPVNSISLNETDALITDIKDIAICISTADCVPLLLYDPYKKITAVVHSGWRGQVFKLPLLTVNEMIKHFDIDVSSLIAAIGPCISSDVYEVGYEVIESVEKVFPEGVIERTSNGKGYLDLVEMTKKQLLEAGVKEKNMQASGICNYKNDDFFSARRDSFYSGRFVTGIVIKA